MKQGFEVDVVDCATKKLTQEQTAELVVKKAPDYIMCELTTPTSAYDYQTLQLIRRKYPAGKILVGGTHATAVPEQVLRECDAVDIVLRQEYDYTIAGCFQRRHVSY